MSRSARVSVLLGRLKNFRVRKLLQIEVIERIILELGVYKNEGIYIIDTS
jgi:hypothetical protein